MTEINTIASREDFLLKKLFRFYSNPTNLNTFKTIVVDGKHVSLRLLDWFATNYSKNHITNINNQCIHSNYKQHLKSYRKHFFDPFCRRQRICIRGKNFDINQDISKLKNPLEFEYEYLPKKKEKSFVEKEHNGFITTIGQLNFFKWCIETYIIGYVIEHSRQIEENMADKKPKEKKVGYVYQTKNSKFTLNFSSTVHIKFKENKEKNK